MKRVVGPTIRMATILGKGETLSRSKKDKKGGHAWAGYGKESTIFKKIWRKRRRLEGKRLMEDDNPDKGTQGWNTW